MIINSDYHIFIRSDIDNLVRIGKAVCRGVKMEILVLLSLLAGYIVAGDGWLTPEVFNNGSYIQGPYAKATFINFH